MTVRLMQMHRPFLALDGDAGGGGGEGGSGDSGGTGSGSGDGGTGGDGGKGERTFTQSEVNAIATREADAAKRTTTEALAKDLGVSFEEAKAILADHKKRTEGEKSEAQRAREAADREAAEAATAKAEAAAERHAARVERQLILADVGKDEKDADAREAKLAKVARLVDAEVGADPDVIKAAVVQLPKEMPELFGATQAPGGGDAGGKPPRNGPKDESSVARGLARAAEKGKVATGDGEAAGPGGYDLPQS